MSIYKVVEVVCDAPGCTAHRYVRVSSTAGGPHEAREKVRTRFLWAWDEERGDRCRRHAA